MCLHAEGHQLMNPLYKQAACPECCVKHLLAAHAFLPFRDNTASVRASLEGEWVLTARAVILAKEVLTGYTANSAVLTGVLAALEQVKEIPTMVVKISEQFRNCRKSLLPGQEGQRNRLLSAFVKETQGEVPLVTYAYANLIEAAREAPVDYEEQLDLLAKEALNRFHEEALKDLSFNLLDIAIDIADAYELLPQENADGQS